MKGKKIFISHVALLGRFSCLFVQTALNPSKVKSKWSSCKCSRFAVMMCLLPLPPISLQQQLCWTQGVCGASRGSFQYCLMGWYNSFCWKYCFQNSSQGGIPCSSDVCAIWPTRTLGLLGAFQAKMTRACHGQSSLLCLCSKYPLNMLWNTDWLFGMVLTCISCPTVQIHDYVIFSLIAPEMRI